MKSKPPLPTKLLWVDLEMTGLSADDAILEIAAEVTGFDFQIRASYEARIRHERDFIEARMAQNPWWQDYPQNRDDFLDKLHTGKPLRAVEQDLLALVDAQFGAEPAILAGNSIHADRAFIRRHWPELDARLHYRMFDVSTLKIYMQGRYGVEYTKKELHRAFDDIHESIAEWQYYLRWLREHAGPET